MMAHDIWRVRHSMQAIPDKVTIEICRPGSFEGSEGGAVGFSPAELEAVAANYTPEFDAPAVLGHPETNTPAYGWVKEVRYDAGRQRLVADIGDIDPSLAAMVRAKKYKKISASFHLPDSPANPKRGAYYLRHVGFLGGAAPAVTGLAPVSMSGAADKIIEVCLAAEDAAANESKKGKMMDFLEKLKAIFVKVLGQEQTEKLMASDELGQALAEESAKAAQKEAGEAAAAAASETPAADPAPAEEEKKKKEASLSALDASLSAREEALRKKEEALREKGKAVIHGNHLSFAAGLVKEGRVLPKDKDRLVAALDAAAVNATVSLSDGTKSSAANIMQEILAGLPKSVPFGKSVPPEKRGKALSLAAPDGYSTDEDSDELYEKAKKYQAEHPDVEWLKCVEAVSQ